MEQNRRRRDLLGVRCTFPRVKNCFLRYEKDVSLRPKGLDLNVTRPLAVSLSEIAVEDKTASKISGQFRKAKLRLANPQENHPPGAKELFFPSVLSLDGGRIL